MTSYIRQLHALHNATAHHQPEDMLPLLKSAADRIAIYADGYTQRLTEAVRMDYPALMQWMQDGAGEKALADFVRTTPSTHWDLNRYPIGFARFLEQGGADAATCALAHLESAITHVFWAAESEAVTAQYLAGLSEEAFGKLRFSMRKAAMLLPLAHNANDYLTAFRQGHPPASMEPQTQYLLVLRIDNEVRRLVLEPPEFALLEQLGNGMPFAEALSRMPESGILATKLPDYLARWLQWGALSLR